MNKIFVICVFVLFLSADERILQEVNTHSINYEFPKYTEDSANSLLDRFSLHDENYFLPAYYTISGLRTPYRPIEAKFQFSAKINIAEDLFYGVGFLFAYTQQSFLQLYSPRISSPLRDSDYMPELLLYRALDWELFGGRFYNLRMGYKHHSNGEDGRRSTGVDMLIAEIMYKNSDLSATFKTRVFLGKEPLEIDKYYGYSDLVLKYDFLPKNHLTLNILNAFHNYKNYKGGILLEYKFDMTKASIYFQYFYGYKDALLQYRHKTQSVGIGLSINKIVD